MFHLDIASIGLDGTYVLATQASQSDYSAAIARGPDLAILCPTCIASPTTPADIPKLMNFARHHKPTLELAIKSGGMHTSTAASSEGGLVIELSKLNRVRVWTSRDRKLCGYPGPISPASDELLKTWVRDTVQTVRDWHKPDLGTFPNIAQGDERLEDIYRGNLARLRMLKAKYDPDGVWCRGLRIQPDFGPQA